MSKTCCFTGHRPKLLGFSEESIECKKLKSSIKKEILNLIESENVTHFISGMALGVDMYAAEIVLELKRTYNITLECALPCETQANKWKEHYRDRYFDIIEKCDEAKLLQTQYTPDCMLKRNKYMVNKSDFVIAVWNGAGGGTANTVRYAKSKDKSIVFIRCCR